MTYRDRNLRKYLGLCRDCTGPIVGESCYCEKHRGYHKEKKERYREDKGRCVICHCELDIDADANKRTCVNCLEYRTKLGKI